MKWHRFLGTLLGSLSSRHSNTLKSIRHYYQEFTAHKGVKSKVSPLVSLILLMGPQGTAFQTKLELIFSKLAQLFSKNITRHSDKQPVPYN